MQRRTLTINQKVGARFITLNGGTVHYTTRVKEFIAEGW
jgi:hypothetical protein